jgi:hypothetical protein
MDVVLVRWSIRADGVEQFKRDFPPLSDATPGLISEDLYRLEDAADDSVAHFVRIGRWESREYFYAALGKLGVAPLTRPQQREYETGDRRREWLSWTRDDIPPRDAVSER